MHPATRPYCLHQTEAFDLDSDHLGRRYEISVALPFSYHAAATRRYPVLVVLDANICFATAVETSRLLSIGQEAEELIVVGVGCPWSEGLQAMGTRRFHEFSPTERWEIDGPFASVTSEMIARAGVGAVPTGGAAKFLDLLTTELLPLIERRYRADLGRPGLFGDSAGGTFALFALFSGRSPFKKYLVGSPATAQCNDEVYRMEERHAATRTDLDAQVFLAAGAEEMMSPFLEGAAIASGVCRMSGLLALRQYPSLRVTSHLFPDEGHLSVVAPILSRGIRTLYATGNRYGAMPARSPGEPAGSR